MTGGTRQTRKPAAVRRAEILEAADAEFALKGLSGAGFEAIAARVGISHPRIVQMFGSKRDLFLEVVHAAYDRVQATFENADPALDALGDAYRHLLQSRPTVGPVLLQAYAAAGDAAVQASVRERQLALQQTVTRLTGADPMQVRSFLATGLVLTVSTVLDLPERRADAEWCAWIIGLPAPLAE
ncbi:TetR/AcrR family transcriptional regulator [Streptomyces acidiscabies]|uniref:Helix-turn-helix domain containing protein n=1 Tax=Streptomyces acidiscabies TaxID=42234 RepID=A0AAP6BBX4_9ACTN|nr:helix-turn-helix domain-containing protein [Streptomyces acidiscabies]MDX2961934.1 helix-turn-helix domain containing protein [Streptomyces acidiscabies]MDX3021818.1 helix-turn-helix domain containing protein [Streptomyces acidiscabies]MDX3789475.1 helix-turn-helix domain containing protein [Streptomyces acidiscabies]GAQ50459.1 putative DNA-binding transcriptional regulator [Streptomyces acidiscabies]GAV37363.1 putative DNA-binding transcriptional regulator [Streptomyces acidiscabies]